MIRPSGLLNASSFIHFWVMKSHIIHCNMIERDRRSQMMIWDWNQVRVGRKTKVRQRERERERERKREGKREETETGRLNRDTQKKKTCGYIQTGRDRKIEREKEKERGRGQIDRGRQIWRDRLEANEREMEREKRENREREREWGWAEKVWEREIKRERARKANEAYHFMKIRRPWFTRRPWMKIDSRPGV